MREINDKTHCNAFSISETCNRIFLWKWEIDARIILQILYEANNQ